MNETDTRSLCRSPAPGPLRAVRAPPASCPHDAGTIRGRHQASRLRPGSQRNGAAARWPRAAPGAGPDVGLVHRPARPGQGDGPARHADRRLRRHLPLLRRARRFRRHRRPRRTASCGSPTSPRTAAKCPSTSPARSAFRTPTNCTHSGPGRYSPTPSRCPDDTTSQPGRARLAAGAQARAPPQRRHSKFNENLRASHADTMTSAFVPTTSTIDTDITHTQAIHHKHAGAVQQPDGHELPLPY